jgi:hypothetical protein
VAFDNVLNNAQMPSIVVERRQEDKHQNAEGNARREQCLSAAQPFEERRFRSNRRWKNVRGCARVGQQSEISLLFPSSHFGYPKAGEINSKTKYQQTVGIQLAKVREGRSRR